MALEIEHKFLINNHSWQSAVIKSCHYQQGYLISDSSRSVRVRIHDDKAWLNIKSATIGSHRDEYEYDIPVQDAHEILANLCEKPIIIKTRHIVPFMHHTWEIDVFEGDNAGLVVAEVELTQIGEDFAKPDWVGVEVTNDLRYYNNNLCKNPYKDWK